MATFTVNGDRVYYEVKGEAADEGRYLIFLHGLGADRRQAIATTQSLKGYRVICVDMPGHGDSECTNSEQLSFKYFADVALALLDKLGIASAVWGGISMGSGIALHAALRCPERVDGLLLVRPAWLDCAGLPNLSIVSQVGQWIEEQGLDKASARLIQSSDYREAQSISQQCADSIAGLLTRPQAESAAGVLPALVQDCPFTNINVMTLLNVPTVVFGNCDDPLHPEFIAKRLADVIAEATYIELPSRYTQPPGHALQLIDNMQEFLTNLEEIEVTHDN